MYASLTTTLAVAATATLSFTVAAPGLGLLETVRAETPQEAIELVVRDCCGHRTSFAAHFLATARTPFNQLIRCHQRVQRLSPQYGDLIETVAYREMYADE